MEAQAWMEAEKEIIKRTISEVTQEYQNNLEQYILEDIKEVRTEPPEEPSETESRAGAYGNVIDLECDNAQFAGSFAGKVLHSIFFTPGTDPSYVRKMLTKFFEEIKLLSKMDHPNIVQFRGIYYRQDSLLPVLVMEKMRYDLDKFLTSCQKGSIPDDKILGILLDVSKGLVYLHEEMKVAHRDLSSKNILLTTKLSAKIADFGSARVLDRPGGWNSLAKLTKQPGTSDFMPPEALEDPPKYTISVDVFSFGCVIIHACTQIWPSPIGKTDQGRIISEFKRRLNYILEMNDSSLIPVIKQCLEDESTKRPTARHVMSLLEAKLEKHTGKIDYTIVFAGITGTGKSTAGNFFLSKEAFPTEEGFNHCTPVCSESISMIHGKKVKIIDTPGFFDEFSSTKESLKEINKAFIFAKDGIHAFAFVMNYGRFTKAWKEGIQQLLQLNKDIQPFIFLLLTNTRRNGITTTATAECIEQCLASDQCAQGFRDLMKMIEKRVIMLEAVDFISESYHEEKCSELLMIIEKVHKRNGNKVYTNIRLQHIAEIYEQEKQKQKQGIQEKVKSLKSNSRNVAELKQLKNGITISANDKEKIDKEIAALLKKKESLEGELEEICDINLIQAANKIHEAEMSRAHEKGSFASNFGSYLLTAAGALVGGAIGSLGGAKSAQVGAAAGAGIGGTATVVIDKNCKQQ